MTISTNVEALHDIERRALVEGLPIIGGYQNGIGIPFPAVGGAAPNWRVATPPVTTAWTWYRALYGVLTPAPGRAVLLRSVEVEVTGPCELLLYQQMSRTQMLDGSSAGNNLYGCNASLGGSVSGASGGIFRWEFPKGLIVRGGDRLDFYYAVSGTSGVNWQMRLDGREITDDWIDAPPLLIIGDSICGITAGSTDVRYLEREDGTVIGMWPSIVQAAMAAAGKQRRIINLGIGGTSSADWDFMVNSGRFAGIKAAEMVVNLGMNDASASTMLSTVAGMDGGTQKALKRIVREFRRLNPNSRVVVNNITDSDTAARVTAVASGRHAGLTRLAAYRIDIAEAVTAMQGYGWNVRLAATDTAYTTSTSGALIESAGSRVHPTGTVGQPLMAPIIAAALIA